MDWIIGIIIVVCAFIGGFVLGARKNDNIVFGNKVTVKQNYDMSDNYNLSNLKNDVGDQS